jgi:starvation-inducible DNA-binding protein
MNAQRANALHNTPLANPTDRSRTPPISPARSTSCSWICSACTSRQRIHWHISEPHFRDYHRLPDEQGDELFATTDAIAERVRKIGE